MCAALVLRQQVPQPGEEGKRQDSRKSPRDGGKEQVAVEQPEWAEQVSVMVSEGLKDGAISAGVRREKYS
jgi:hypothetical protein